MNINTITQYLLISAIALFAIVFYKWLKRYLHRKENHQKYVYFFPFDKKMLSGTEQIKLEMPFAAKVSAKLLDVNGKFVKDIFDQELGSGTHSLVFECGDLSDGEYQILLKSPFQKSRRSILIRNT